METDEWMRCTVCSVDKFITDFHHYVYMTVGIQPICDMCCAETDPDYSGRPKKYRVPQFTSRRSKQSRAELYREQLGLCAICQRPFPFEKLVDDHDHHTGWRRGLLCHGCNIGLGNFHDSPRRLRAAARYVKLHRRLAAQFREMVDAAEEKKGGQGKGLLNLSTITKNYNTYRGVV